MQDIIDVEYREINSGDGDRKSENPENQVVINADPVSAAISGVCDVFNHATEAVKEYSICKQREITERSRIKADMKIALTRIDAQKEVLLRVIDNQHAINMANINKDAETMKSLIENYRYVINGAIQTAKDINDFQMVLMLIESQNNAILTQRQLDIELMKTVQTANKLEDSSKIAGYLV